MAQAIEGTSKSFAGRGANGGKADILIPASCITGINIATQGIIAGKTTLHTL